MPADPTEGLDAQTVQDINRAVIITWQRELKRRRIQLPEPELDASFLETPRGQKAYRLMREIGIDPKSPWAPPLWNLNAKYHFGARDWSVHEKKASKKKPSTTRKSATQKKASSKTDRTTTDGFIDRVIRKAGTTIGVTVATDAKVTGNWTARGEKQMRAVLKKALAQARMLAKRGYRTCLAVAYDHGGSTVECWPK